MAKEGKKPVGKIIAIVIVVLVVVGVIGSMGGKKTTTTAPVDSSAQQEQPADASKGDVAPDAAKDDKAEDSTENLAIGTTVNLPSGLSVTVDSVQTGLTNYDGAAMTGIRVTYVNNGEDGADYNIYDWKCEDANGAQQSTAFYSEETDVLSSGTLAKGGTVSGNIYFAGALSKALYFDNMLSKTAAASWALS